MKTIGLIGGITWLSTVEYYKYINILTNEKLGGVSSAKIILVSVDFTDVKNLTLNNDWQGLANLMIKAGLTLQKAGADCLLIGANTMHKIAGEVQTSLSIPLINIAIETAKIINAAQINKVALLGTKYTMQLDFYKKKLNQHNIEVLIPNAAEIEYINNSIYNEMGIGNFLTETKTEYLKIIENLKLQGAQGIIMGCTEIPILLKDIDAGVPLFDTTYIHSKAAVDFALKDI